MLDDQKTKDKNTIEDNQIVLGEFQKFCRDSKKLTAEQRAYLGDDPWDEIDFHDLSLGFFVAKGVDLIDAYDLARICRYTFQYWS